MYVARGRLSSGAAPGLRHGLLGGTARGVGSTAGTVAEREEAPRVWEDESLESWGGVLKA